MAKSQFRSVRKVSGKKYTNIRKKRLCDLARDSALTHINKLKMKVKRVLGGNKKLQVLSTDFINVSNGNKTKKVKILSVENNPADVNFTRRNIITKGAILKTDSGNVVVTSRCGQNGILSGKMIK